MHYIRERGQNNTRDCTKTISCPERGGQGQPIVLETRKIGGGEGLVRCVR